MTAGEPSPPRSTFATAEEHVIKRGLEGASMRLTDCKSRAYLSLRRAENFEISFPVLLTHRLHRGGGKVRIIAIPAEMAQHHTLNFPREQFRKHGGSGSI